MYPRALALLLILMTPTMAGVACGVGIGTRP
jgi:hypothetical protein